MSTDLDDLRARLAFDAETVAHTPDPDRAEGVHARVRMMRRRRRAAMTGGVVAAVAAVAFAVPVLTTGNPANPPVAAMPETVEIYGFTYDLDSVHRSEPGAESLDVDLEASEATRAVAIETDGLAEGTVVTLRAEQSAPVGVYVVGGADLPPVPIHDATSLQVSIDEAAPGSRVELGVYERTDALPDGLDDGTVVFRDQVAEDRLAAGAFLEEGATSGSFTVDGPLRDLEFARFCDPGEERMSLTIAIDGDLLSSGRCRDEDSIDAHSGGLTGFGGRDPGPHTIEFWTSEQDFSEDRVAFDGARVGVAVYRVGDVLDVDGQRVDRYLEADGRVWEVERVAGRSTDVDLAAEDQPRLLSFVAAPQGDVVTSLHRNARPGVAGIGVSSGGWIIDSVVWPGQQVAASLHSQRGEPADGSIVIYRPVE